jgi:transposase
MIDTSIVRVHQHAASIARNKKQSMGRSRGGLTSKIHAVVDTNGLPVQLALTAGEAHDNRLAGELLSRLKAGTMLLADRGYDADWIRDLATKRGVWANIPPRSNRKEPICFSPYLYRARNLVERFFNKIKQVSSGRNSLRQARLQLPRFHPTRVDQAMGCALMSTRPSLIGHDANHWRDFRYSWAVAAAGARGTCWLRSPSSMPGILAALTYLRGSARWHQSTPFAETLSRRLEREPTCDPGHRDRWLPHLCAHILPELDPQAADNVDAVIYGHSHQPKIETKNGTLFFNPGSAGPRRFHLPITVGRMIAEHGKLRAEIVELSVER